VNGARGALRAVLAALAVAFAIGFGVGLWLRCAMERPVRLIGDRPIVIPPLSPVAAPVAPNTSGRAPSPS